MTVTTPSKPHCFGVALLLAGVMLLGCEQREAEQRPTAQPKPTQNEAFTRETLDVRVTALIEESINATEPGSLTTQTPDGKTIALEGRRPKFAPGRAPLPLPNLDLWPDIPEPVGDVMLRVDELPAAIAVTNTGELVYTTPAGVMLREADGSEALLLDAQPDSLLFDANGERLLAQEQNDIWILSGSDLRQKRLYESHPPGKASWALAEDTLLFVNEQLDLDASHKNRIDLTIEVFGLGDTEPRPASWSVMGRYARIGTLPAIGRTWGHFTKPYLIDPVPAPILLLDEGTPVDYATQTADAADTQPCADSAQRFFWIRTWGRRGNTGRLYYRSLAEGSDSERQLSGLPTYQVATAHNGNALVYTVKSSTKGFEVRLLNKDSITRHDSRYERFAAIDRAMIANINGFSEDLRSALTARPLGQGLGENEFGPFLDAVPAPQDIQALTEVMRVALKERFGIEATPGMAELAMLDAFMNEVGDYLNEDPALIIAIAGAFADAMPRESTWYLEDATTSLNIDVREIMAGDDLSYSAIPPFGIARERIARRLNLQETALKIIYEAERPIYMVENLSTATMQGIELKEWETSGLPRKQLTLSQLRDYLVAAPNNDTINLSAINVAKIQQQNDLAIQAALNLAGANPDSGKAFKLLGESLFTGYHTPLALEVFAHALLLTPFDPHLRFEYADCLMSIDRLEEAREQYGLASELDFSGAFAEQLASRLRLLEELENPEANTQ